MQSTLLKILFLFIAGNTFLFAQEPNIETEIKNKKADYYISFEQKIKSEPYESNTNFITPYAQPLIFKRKEKDIPDLLVYYYFTKNDSIVKKILYEWDVNNFEDEENNPKPQSFQKKMIKKYNSILSTITSKYGESTSTGSLDDLSQAATENGIKKSDEWNTNDTEAELYITLSNYYNKEGIITTPTTHKIRYYLKETAKQNAQASIHEKQTALDSNFKKFITSVENNNFEEAKNLCSQKIRHSITQELINQIKPTLTGDSKLTPYMAGMQIMQDGNSYPMIKYKYENDTNTPPVKLVNVFFDNDNTILGIQPIERSEYKATPN
ncbi:hypothetical protein [Flavobacterium beibuense]|uniref:hypothetical protein n=1 Tax=Flavobacterium beibuense TaxID=657326 RepID=UPI003A8E9229